MSLQKKNAILLQWWITKCLNVRDDWYLKIKRQDKDVFSYFRIGKSIRNTHLFING